MSGQQLFIFSGVRWNFTWQRHHSLARAASEAGYDVTFVLPTPRSVRQIMAHVSGNFGALLLTGLRTRFPSE